MSILSRTGDWRGGGGGCATTLFMADMWLLQHGGGDDGGGVGGGVAVHILTQHTRLWDGNVWEGRTCIHALMKTTRVYDVSIILPFRSPWSHECNCIIYPSAWYVYSIFCRMRYIWHTILFYDTPYYILFLRVTPYYILGSWASSILFCTLHLLWSTCISILHTSYSIIQRFILHLNIKYTLKKSYVHILYTQRRNTIQNIYILHTSTYFKMLTKSTWVRSILQNKLYTTYKVLLFGAESLYATIFRVKKC